MDIRRPAVAGAFYPESPEVVRQEIETCFRHRLGPGAVPKVEASGPRQVLGSVSPHAGYAFSGPAASHGFSALAGDGCPDLFVIVGPNHRGLGAHVAVGARGYWETPLGRSQVDEVVAQEIIANSGLAEQDEWSHLLEHSVEVQLPFLQYLYGERFRFVPIILADQDLETARDLGRSLAVALQGKNAVIIASTDFTHYEQQRTAEQNDALAMAAIVHLDEALLAKVVRQRAISMCGVGPVMAMLVAAKLLGASRAEILKYVTSGDLTGDKRSVVGYASLSVTKQ